DITQIIAGHSHDGVRLAAEAPLKQINVMNALVHQRAAVLSPGAAPRSLLIIRHRTVPKNTGRTVDKLSETAVLKGTVQLADRSVKAVLMANADRNALLLRLREDFLRIGCGKGHRLFNQHIFPVRDAVKRNCGMITALRRNGAAIDRKLLKR